MSCHTRGARAGGNEARGRVRCWTVVGQARCRLDDALCDALRTSTEAFIANDPESFDHLNIEQIDGDKNRAAK